MEISKFCIAPSPEPSPGGEGAPLPTLYLPPRLWRSAFPHLFFYKLTTGHSSLTHFTYCKSSQNLCAAQADFPTLRTYRAQLIRPVCLTQHSHQYQTLYLDRPRDINNFATITSIKNQPSVFTIKHPKCSVKHDPYNTFSPFSRWTWVSRYQNVSTL